MSFAAPPTYGQQSNSGVWPSQYGYEDEKDDEVTLRDRLAAKKKPIAAGVGLLCLVILGVTIAVSTGGSNKANTQSGAVLPQAQHSPAPSSSPSSASSAAGETTDAPGKVVVAKASWSGSGSSSMTVSGSGSHHADAGAQVTPSPSETTTNTSSPSTTQAAQTSAPSSSSPSSSSPSSAPSTTSPPSTTSAPAPTTTTSPPANNGPQLPYKAVDFDWKNAGNWQFASGAAVNPAMFTEGGIKLTSANSYTPIRTKQGWSGEKVVLIEWERSDASDTNIWMLNTKLENQFGKGNGWPYWGELDIFEMFTQDAIDKKNYDFRGFGSFSSASSYGQLTMHMGPAVENGDPCFCPAAPSKSAWYQNSQPMTSGCTAQFSNDPKNAIATVWGSDGNGKYIQLMQNPKITKGGKTGDGKDTYDVSPGGATTQKIYNNANTFWGVPSSAACASKGGHNPNTGFPFFEAFRIVLEEQKKNDGGAWFKVNNIQIFSK